MKKALVVLTVLVLLSIGKTYAQENFKWQPEDSFHTSAMEAFHGAEENEMKPARDSAAVMLSKAEDWKNAPIPSGYDAAAVKPLLQALYDQCKAINDAVVAKKSDTELKPLVIKAHHTFHEIVEKTQ